MKCKRAYIIFVADNKQNRINKFNIENILNELSMLCDTANYKVIERYSFIQQKIDSRTYIGKGKLESIKEKAIMDKVKYIIFDNELSGSQVNSI